MKNLLKKTLLTLSIASSLCASEIKYNPGLVEYSIFNVSKDGFKDFVVEQKIDPAVLQNLYGDMSNPRSVLITAIAYDYGHQRPDLAEPFYEEAFKKEYGGFHMKLRYFDYLIRTNRISVVEENLKPIDCSINFKYANTCWYYVGLYKYLKTGNNKNRELRIAKDKIEKAKRLYGK